MPTTNLADHRLSIYDIVDTMRTAFKTYKNHDKHQVAITTPEVATTIRKLIAQYQPTDKRDPSTELAEIREIVVKWGELTIHEDLNIPPGTILFMDKRDFHAWKQNMEIASQQHVKSSIVGIGKEN